MGLWRDGGQDLREAWDQRLSVRLVHPVLHCRVDEFWVRWGSRQCGGQDGQPLQVEDHVLRSIRGWQHTTGGGSGNLKVWDDGNALHLSAPVVLDMATNVMRWDWRGQTGVVATGWLRKHLCERDLLSLHLRRCQVTQVGPNEPTHHGRGDVVRMALNHQTVVEHSLLGEGQSADLVTQDDTGNDSSSGGAQASAKRNWILDMDLGSNWELSDVVTAQHVKCGSRDQVLVRLERDASCALGVLRIGEQTVVRVGVGQVSVLGINGDVELEEQRQADPQNVETGPDVRRGGRHADGEVAWHCDGGGCPLEPVSIWSL